MTFRLKPAGAGAETFSMSIEPDRRYAEITRQLAPVAMAGAAAITLMTFLEVRDPSVLAIAGALQIAIVAFNWWFKVVVLPRLGARAEILRLGVNVAGTLVLARQLDWPIAIWLWPSFVALAFDPIARWAPISAVLSLALPMGVLAVYDGVAWTTPVASIGFALFSCEISRVRHQAMCVMLDESDEHREALSEAHASVKATHERFEQEVANREQVEVELRSAQKLEAIGRLASGIAHEINTPVQFVGDSIHFVRDAIVDLLRLVAVSSRIRRAHEAGEDPSALFPELAEAEDAADLPYLDAHLPAALERALDGVNRVAVIVRSMKQFAHPEQKEMTSVDLNQAIAATLIIAKHEYKLVADVQTDLQPLPFVICHPGEVNQVFLNIVVNAAHAIGDVVGKTGTRGQISIRTTHDDKTVSITIGDTGGGIPDRARDKIFEPFFTTKEVGRGTGQGLALARSIIDRHGGQLTFETELGRGTTFTIRIPIRATQALANVA